jgi:hypothetical protein
MKNLETWLKNNNKKIKELTRDDWHNISYHCELSEDFIREYADKVKWGLYFCISEAK